MKKIIFSLVVLILASCKNEPKNYATFSGKITNKNSDSIVISSRALNYSKIIVVDENGVFSDTLKVEDGIYSFYDGKESTSIFLKNGYDIQMTLDSKMFDETAKYTGEGAENSNFLAEKSLLQEKLLNVDFDTNNLEALKATFNNAEEKLTDFVNSSKNIDTIITNSSLESISPMINSYKNYFLGIAKLKASMPKGSKSPSFEDYQNSDGSKTSLADLKGKYVYIDVWATWCGPCKAEIPSLKKIEKEYHGKNIAFVSISVDDDRRSGSWEKAKESWKSMIADKELGGIQLFAPKAWISQFISDYKINSIPRFLLIDPNGDIVDASAPRPSSKELIKLFDQENI